MTDLVSLGLKAGDQIRFRTRDRGRWELGVVVGRERDGSVRIRDAKGAARALHVDRLEVRRDGPRGARRWEPAVDVAARSEQLGLFE